jgi:hypothetical protein
MYFYVIFVYFLRDGRLQRNTNTDQLPTREQLNLRPNSKLLRPETSADFVAGDHRANEHPFLSSLHTVFMREHNRIAKLLKEYLPIELQGVSFILYGPGTKEKQSKKCYFTCFHFYLHRKMQVIGLVMNPSIVC